MQTGSDRKVDPVNFQGSPERPAGTVATAQHPRRGPSHRGRHCRRLLVHGLNQASTASARLVLVESGRGEPVRPLDNRRESPVVDVIATLRPGSLIATC